MPNQGHYLATVGEDFLPIHENDQLFMYLMGILTSLRIFLFRLHSKKRHQQPEFLER